MDLDPSAEQRELQEMITRFSLDRFPTDIVRAAAEPGRFDRAAWRELAELGTFGIAVDEEAGGVGLRWIDAVLVHESLGAALTPGPLVAAALAAGLVDGVLDGSVVPAIVERPTHGPAFVEHLTSADVLLVIDQDGVSSIDPATVNTRALPTPTDPATPVSIIEELPSGDRLADADTARRWRLLGSLLASAQLVGIAEGSTTLAVAYANEREQFGRPIGSFQGLKHLLADCYARTEVARSALWAAGVLVDEPEAGDLMRAVAGTRVLAARAATENAKTGLQVHGGMGFTWEVDAHLFLKRAWVLETAFGSVDEAAEAVAASLEPGSISS
ncbi:MAG: acyl-CoA/acyl-ACP dehydrogenase [Acidobacteria bacterium]|nr:acyl-CoA/acyl-ACP dehydrogenase [Acidobacteriota bacterium]